MDIIKISKHIAIMMDGNGRWAKRKFMPRTFGHRQGIKTLENICKDTYDLGVEYLTIYAFSTENWSRPKDEIIRTTKKIALKCLNNKLDVSRINEDLFASYMDTCDIPEPDLFIRTGGEKRLSNFLLWEMAYTELYFVDVLWPDFKKDDLEKAIYDFSKRDRRYGNVIE
ncbi:MAG: undecaprenyl diphosphate synthase family protein [Tepidibacter sp.]|jgi:undecaprenyl pyrophosphate synthase|uniref:undecaprenyl diphosphate synthase family protein n=1 Tax=Tepidibacter sp. TaxID=2529387 RepID=UPI0025D3DD81|nr:undecaprenyl diphosphate synthase family protein [Tepidibacter sp.]MCT4509569.1 undecaprenyl diphosphate synthase family protein [Tepidibacter sp.]